MRFINATKLLRYELEELFSKNEIIDLNKFQSRQESKLEYYGKNGFYNSTNQFSIREDGQISVCHDNLFIYVENWTKSIQSVNRVFKFLFGMTRSISMINVDFERGFVVCGDQDNNLLIQNIYNSRLLYKNNKLVLGKNQKIISSSILNKFMCIGTNSHHIESIDLNTFSNIPNLSFQYDGYKVTSLQICRVNKNPYLIASGNNKFKNK